MGREAGRVILCKFFSAWWRKIRSGSWPDFVSDMEDDPRFRDAVYLVRVSYPSFDVLRAACDEFHRRRVQRWMAGLGNAESAEIIGPPTASP